MARSRKPARLRQLDRVLFKQRLHRLTHSWYTHLRFAPVRMRKGVRFTSIFSQEGMLVSLLRTSAILNLTPMGKKFLEPFSVTFEGQMKR